MTAASFLPLTLSQRPPAIVRHSVSDQVLAELRRQIVHGEIPDATPIPEAQFAQSLGVSRVPVREALLRLERDGLLVTNNRGKSVVRTFTTHDYREIPGVRLELEGLAARLATTARTPADLLLLQQNIGAFAAATTPEELAHLDVEFHHLLCAAAHHTWLQAAWQAIRWPFEAILVRNFRQYVQATSLRESKGSTADHSRIVEAIARQDATTSETLLRQHISRWEEWTPTA